MRNVCAGILLAVVVACRASSPEPAEVTAAVAVPPGPLELDLLAALGSEDAAVVVDALRLLDWFAGPAHVAPIGAVLAHADAAVREAAARALGLLVDRHPEAAPTVSPLLVRALRDGSRQVVEAAILACASCPLGDWSDLEGLVGDASWQTRAYAAAALARHGVALAQPDVAMVLRDVVGTHAERWAAYLFPCLTGAAGRQLLEPFRASTNAKVRFRAEEACERLAAIAAGAPPDTLPASARRRRDLECGNRAAEQELARAAWCEVPRAELLAAVAQARLVTFGEMHDDGGPLRDAQIQVLGAMVAAAPGRVVVGYEPSVRSAQQLVLDHAAALGVRCVPLEHDYEALLEAGRYAERDDQAAAAITALLAAEPRVRVLVLRGESHTMPAGYLERLLPERPLCILSTTLGTLDAVRTTAGLGSLAQRTFRATLADGDAGARRDVFVWPMAAPLAWVPDFAAWAAARGSVAEVADRRRLATAGERVSQQLSAATAAEDAEVRAEAVMVLEHHGTAEHVEALLARLTDESSGVRAAAARALGLVCRRHPEVGTLPTAGLLAALGDGVHPCRVAAVRALRHALVEDWSQVAVCLGDAALELRCAAAVTMARRGAPLHPSDVAGVLRELPGTGLERFGPSLFARLTEPADRALLAPFLASEDPRVRLEAEACCGRLEAAAAGRPWLPPAWQQAELRYRAANAAAERRLHELPWTKVAEAELAARVRAARLVVFGEGHEWDGPLRQAQRRLLDWMVEAAPGRVVVGYEPSVQETQQSVLDHAAALGVPTVALEGDDFAALNDAERYAERDDQAIARIRALLAADDGCRLLVLRGESHTLPGGYLDAALPVEPLVVLTICEPPLPVLGLGDDMVGTFRIGDSGRVYRLAWEPPFPGFPTLMGWIAARAAAAGR